MKTITVDLTASGIAKAQQDLMKYQSYIRVRCNAFRIALAQKLREIASDLYASAWYNDFVNGHRVQGEALPAMFMSIDNREDTTALVVNNEVAVFIEFGAGVYHNGEAFHSPHPWGERLGFTIGSYPENRVPSKGVNPSWSSPDGVTRGTEAQMVLYKAVRMLEPHIEDIAREVFKE